MNHDQSADLEKKSRELEQREQALNARENLLEREKALEKRQKVFDDATTKLDVLNKQIKAKQAVLDGINEQIEIDSKGYKDKLASLKAQETAIKQAIATKEGVEQATLKKIDAVNMLIKEKNTELQTIKDHIKESKEYRDEQASIVEATINEWNDTLKDFQREAENLQKEKNVLSADIIRLEQEKTAMAVDTHKEETRLQALGETYEAKAEEYRRNLKSLDGELTDAQNRLSSLNHAQAMKVKELEVREKAISLKQVDIQRRTLELDQKERRLRNNYNMADMNYENDV